MRDLRRTILQIFLICGFCSHSASGNLLASWDYSGVTDGQIGHNTFQMTLAYHLAMVPEPRYGHIFDEFLFETSDIGQTFTVDEWNDPDFLTFSSYASDGNDHIISYDLKAHDSSGHTYPNQESSILGTGSASTNSIDLQGYRVDSISFHLTDLKFSYLDPNAPTNIIIVPPPIISSIHGTFSIEGSVVPEPNTIVLILLGATTVTLRRRYSQSKRINNPSATDDTL